MCDMSTWKKVWAMLDMRERRNALFVLGIVIIGALSSALMVGSVVPFLSVLSDPGRIQSTPVLAWSYDAFGFRSEYGFLVGLGVASLAVIVFTSLMQIVKAWVVAQFTMMRMHSISHRLLSAYLRQQYEFFLNRHSGEIGTRILAESGQVVQQFLRPAADAVAAMLTVIAILVLLLWVEPVVTLIAFGLLGGIYGGIYTLSRRYVKRMGQERASANSARFRIANEALGGIKDIKLLGREASYAARYARPSQNMARTLVSVQVVTQVPQFVLQSVAFGGMILLCLALMDREGLGSGAGLDAILPLLGMFAFAGQRLMPELARLYQSFSKLQAGAAAVDIVYDDLVEKAGSGMLPKTLPAGLGLKRQLTFDSVSYRYPNTEDVGLKDICLDIAAGEKIGVVGSTGAGKTTLADVALGLLAPTAGHLTVDGTPLTEENVRSWQQSVGYVPQDIFLTDASVSENIALGVPPLEIDDTRVKEAARIARIDHFIQSELPEKYETTIGERGVRLSGGQRQRIGIARALYHDADFVVFDEATSALDNLTEVEVMSAIDALPGDKTVLIIAHRLSTVEKCDRIIVLDKGAVVGFDHWEALMRKNAEFRRIARVDDAA